MMAAVEIEHWVVMGNTKTQEIQKEKVNHSLEFHNLCETPENSNFLKNGKIVISIKIRNFSRSRMMNQISPLESSREI